jgi:hypothetical protein
VTIGEIRGSVSHFPRYAQSVVKATFNFRGIGLGKLVADALARHGAGKFMQIQCESQTILAGHLPVPFYLHGLGRFGCH